MSTPAPSYQDLFDLTVAAIKASRPDLDVADGDVSKAFADGASAACDAVLGYVAKRLRDLFFSTAKGDALDTIIMDRLNVPRNTGEQAYGSLRFIRTGGGPGGQALTGSQFTGPIAADGTQPAYVTESDLTAPSGAFTIDIPVHCLDFGTSGNRTGDTNAFGCPSGLFDPTIRVTNPGGMAGGVPPETDEDYLIRAVNLWLSQRRGTLAALISGCLTVQGVTVANVAEDMVTGLAMAFVSDSDGNSTLEMVYRSKVAMEAWRAVGACVEVTGGQRASLSITISIDDYRDGFDVAAAAELIRDAVVTRGNILRVNQNFTQDQITAAVVGTFPRDIFSLTVTNVVVNSESRDATVDVVANGMLIRVDSVTVVDGKQ